MRLGDVIRKYRKNSGMTQEEMANRLGVTAPAVNKWENNNTLPDVALLAPIARLLGITTDELLSFQEELTAEEINQFLSQLQKDLEEKDYHDVFLSAKKMIQAYPNCESLIWRQQSSWTLGKWQRIFPVKKIMRIPYLDGMSGVCIPKRNQFAARLRTPCSIFIFGRRTMRKPFITRSFSPAKTRNANGRKR